MYSASTQCPHSDVAFDLNYNHMADSNVHSLEVKAKCNICGVKMNLGRGLAMGASSLFSTRAFDGNLGILIPVLAEGETPSKEWGFALSGPYVVRDAP